MERVLDLAPRTAQDRLRVARALGTLPRLTAALTDDKLAFSAVRELTRVATPATEVAWITAAAGKNLRQIEELVADHRRGDGPDDPPDPTARTHVVRFELAAETFALLRQARTAVNDEHGTNLSDDAFVAALCSAVLDGAPAGEPSGRARFQIAVTVCQRCRRGWQEGAGAEIPIDPEAVDRAMCDAQHIGSIDGAAPERAYQAYNLVRLEIERVAAELKVSPLRISFVAALREVAEQWHFATIISPGTIPARLSTVTDRLRQFLLPPRRTERVFPRAVKIKMSNDARKLPAKSSSESRVK